MASDVRKITLIGRLGADGEMRYLPNGTAVVNFRVATNREFSRDGEKVKETTWDRAAIFGKFAEAVGPYLTKGKQVYLEGRPVPKSYVDKDGETVNYLEIMVDTLQLLGGGGNGSRLEIPEGEAEETITF